MKKTARQIQEQFFRELRPGQFLEQLFDALPNAHLFVKDRQGRFVAASPGFARQMGAGSVEEILGKTDHDFTADFLAEAFVKDDAYVLKKGKPIFNKVELVPVQNSLDWLTTSKVPLFNRSGKVVGLGGITRRTEDSDALYRRHPVVHRIVDYIGEHYPRKLTVKDLADHTGISPSSVERLFRSTFGISPLKFVKKVRLHAACKMLRQSGKPLALIAEECGFTDPTTLSRDFRHQLKISPRDYRIRFAAGKTLSGPAAA